MKESGRTAASAVVHVSRLDKTSVRSLLAAAYPEARIPQLEAADAVTQGHPYLVQLLIGAASTVDLDTALATISASGSAAFVSELLCTLAPDQRRLLSTLALLGFPFSTTHVSRLGGTPAMLADLATRSLIARAGGDSYRVHEIVANLIAQTTTDDEQREIRERIALFLRSLESHTWFEVRAMLNHARAASLHEISREAGAILLNFAMRVGFWSLAQEAAESLIQDSESSRGWYPHFVLGKCKRMTEYLESAVKHYAAAEDRAEDVRAREVSQYERASALCGLGRRDEADVVFEVLAKSADRSTRIEAKLGLALGLPERAGVDAALAVLQEALQEARDARLQREEAQVEQSIGFILTDAERWAEARVHLLRAHDLRLSAGDDQVRDIYGWHALLATALRVERALGDKEGAANAAHSLYHFARVAGSPAWEASSAHALCQTEPNADDEDVVGAIVRLQVVGSDTSLDPQARAIALSGLILCEWALHHYEAALEAMLDLHALREEHRVGGPAFVYVPSDGTENENIKPFRDHGVYFLLIPPGETPEFLYRLIDQIVARRPELARYVSIFQAVLPQTDTSSK